MTKRNWSPEGTPGPGDNLIVRHGAVTFSDTALWGSQFWLGSYNQAAPARLTLNNSSAQITTAGMPEDGVQGSIGVRYADITARGASVVYLETGSTRYGGSVVNMSVPVNSNVTLHTTLAGNADLNIRGQGTVRNIGSTMSAAEADIVPAVEGMGEWYLAGNARLEFHNDVGDGQVVRLRANSDLVLHEADSFEGTISTEHWAGEVILDGIQADQASYAADVLTLIRGNQATDIKLVSPGEFQVFSTETGAKIVGGLYSMPEPGQASLLNYAGP